MDAYKILQVEPDCEDEVLRGADRARAMTYHPDHDDTRYAARRMAELNEAYALVRDPVMRARYDTARRRLSSPVQPAPGVGAPAPARSATAGSRLPFGRYEGWTLRDLARQDPDYLRWLSRHTSGLRYRTEIYAILGNMATPAA